MYKIWKYYNLEVGSVFWHLIFQPSTEYWIVCKYFKNEKKKKKNFYQKTFSARDFLLVMLYEWTWVKHLKFVSIECLIVSVGSFSN